MRRTRKRYAGEFGLTAAKGKAHLDPLLERIQTDESLPALRSVLVVGATAVIQHVQRGGRPSPWLTELLKRKSPKLAVCARRRS
jgi:transposase